MKPIIAFLLLTACLHAQPALHTAGHAIVDAPLMNIDATGHLIFRTAEQQVPLNRIVRWSSGRGTKPGSAVAFLDGSWLAGQLQWPTDRRVRIVSQWFEALEMDVDDLRAVMPNPSPSWPETQKQQLQMLKVSGSQDVLWKRGSDSAAGIVTIQLKKSIDPASPDRVVWNFKAQPNTAAVEIPPAELAGVAFSPILRRVPAPCPTCAHVNLIDGSRLMVKELKRREDGRVECTLASGMKLLSLDEADQFVLSIAQITASPDRVSWLSDSEPARYRLLESDSRVPWPLGRNADLFGKALYDAQGQAIEHALVMHSPAQAAYRADGQPARLLATVEILKSPPSGSSVAPAGSAQCQVLVGRNGQLASLWQSEVIRIGQAPVMVDVDVSNAQLIVLLVDQADTGTLGDHVLWRDVRVVSE